jgi:SAM-dependent methyltransferase
VRTLARTLSDWFDSIVAWHRARVSNGPTEGMNNPSKRVTRVAFGLKIRELPHQVSGLRRQAQPQGARLHRGGLTRLTPQKPEVPDFASLQFNDRILESGRRDSNPRPSPWQGDALPLRHFRVGLHSIAPAATQWRGQRSSPLARFHDVRQDENTAILSRSFGEVADEYNRLRSGPSGEALDWLLPRSATDVLEIGAGTGILTRLLAERVPHVIAVEPDDRMRAVLAAADPAVDVRAGQGEELPAESSSVDVVTAQSAWHWVDESRAIPEVARVLRPGGRLSLVWTGPDRSVDWMRSLWAGGIIFSPEEKTDEDDRRKRRHLVSVDAGGDSPFLEPETKLFRWTRPMTKADLVALSATYSTVITMDDATRRRHLEAMARFLETHEALQRLDVIDVPMRSYCWRAIRA